MFLWWWQNELMLFQSVWYHMALLKQNGAELLSIILFAWDDESFLVEIKDALDPQEQTSVKL